MTRQELIRWAEDRCIIVGLDPDISDGSLMIHCRTARHVARLCNVAHGELLANNGIEDRSQQNRTT